MENSLTENTQINQEETFLCSASRSDAKKKKQTNKQPNKTRPVPNGRCSAFWLGRKTQKFSGTKQKWEWWRPFGTGLVRHCPQVLFSPFFTFLRAIFFHPFRLSLTPTICPWVSEDDPHQPTNEFINLMTSNSLYPLISKPTRITSSTATLIDNIFTNNLEGNMNCCILYSDLSDRMPVFQVSHLKMIVEPPRQKRFVRLINSTTVSAFRSNWKVSTGVQSIPIIL